eukprot:4982840-Pyramimonas_sp.AAC.1
MAGRAIGARPIPQAFEDTGGSNRRQRWVDQSDPFVAAQAYDGRTLWTRSSSYGEYPPYCFRAGHTVLRSHRTMWGHCPRLSSLHQS